MRITPVPRPATAARPGRQGAIARLWPPGPANKGPLLVSLLALLVVVISLAELVPWMTQSLRTGQINMFNRALRLNARSWKPVRKVKTGDTFGTIFHSELSAVYKAHGDKPETDKLIAMLRSMQGAGIKTVVYSMSWEWTEPQPKNIRHNYIDMLLDSACKHTNLKVDMIVDLVSTPTWLRERYTDSSSQDADGRTYTRMSWFHPAANQEARRFLFDVATYLATKYAGCASAIQPVYNNEYEAKFTQEYDSYQDYSPYALAAYREYLHSKGTQVELLNVRWGTSFRSWQEVQPPKLRSGTVMGVDFSARYWDWIRFREIYGASVFITACATVQAAGLKCFHHFPEFFTVIDAMYGATMFKRIAASPTTDFIILDSNFRTPYGTVMNPHKLRLYISAAHAYGKPVYFEAAVERYASFDLLGAGYRMSLLSGVENLGITNWISRVDMNQSLFSVMQEAGRAPAACTAPDELVGVFLHLDSCASFHGLQRGWLRKDPLHYFVEDLAERLAARCETDAAVYIELDQFLAHMPSFTRAIFVEPLVLYDSAEFATYLAVKAALTRLPHDVLHLPTNVTSGPQLVVLQDMPKVPTEGAPAAAAASYIAAAGGGNITKQSRL